MVGTRTRSKSPTRKTKAEATDNGPTKKARTESHVDPALEKKAIDTIRVLAADIVQKAKSGHPGAPMGMAPLAYTLWTKVMNYSPANPEWKGRDRFVLSNGHACALLYSMLYLSGYDSLSMDDLKQFRQIDSRTPGHPENFILPGVEVSTGPLGQGISNAVGMAMAEKHMGAVFNKGGHNIIDNYTYVFCGDGCLQEGVSSEASSLAGHLGLGKLIVLYDDNQITIDGETDLSFTEDVLKRYEAYHWHTQTVDDANNIQAVLDAIEEAKSVTDKPSIIKVKTIIGFGSVNQGKEKVHGAALGDDDVAQVKTKFGFDPAKKFDIADDVLQLYRKSREVGKQKEQEWDQRLEAYQSEFPKEGAELQRRFKEGELPAGWKEGLPTWTPQDDAKATRQTSQIVLNAIAERLPELVGGSADLTPSTLTALKCSHDFQKDTPDGRYLRFGVREHGMAAICNGMFAYGGLRPFGATFLNFITYAWGSVRLSALSRFGILYIMTHDSIGLGEDGPTHQPIETMELLRATPNMYAFRPADGNEVTGSYIQAIENMHTPSVLALSRAACPNLEGSSAEKVAYGAYVLQEHGSGDKLDLVLTGTGSELSLCVDVAKDLAKEGKRVRVVSFPCWELFDLQSQEYQLSVFPEGAPIMSVEASGIQGWQRWAHAPFGLDRFGASGPVKDVYKKFGFTVENLTKQAKKVLDFYKQQGHPVQSLIKRPQLDMEHGTGLHGGHASTAQVSGQKH